jgi:hypothetical protein
MPWRPEVFFAAFSRSGLLLQAVYKPAGVATPFEVGFTAPDSMLISDQHQSADIEIEWQTSALQPVRKGDPIDITMRGGAVVAYCAAEHARSMGDGTFSRVYLEQA